jgi:hypothetical protein
MSVCEYIDLDRLGNNAPKNESKTHYILKQAGRAWLWSQGFRIVGTEIGYLYNYNAYKDYDMGNPRYIADCVAVGHRGTGKNRMLTCKAIEVKVSKSDFKAGYCTGADFTYILAPKGIIPSECIPNKIGFLEADMDKLSIKIRPVIEVVGIEVVKRSSFVKHTFGNVSHHDKMVRLMGNIASQNTREVLRTNDKTCPS